MNINKKGIRSFGAATAAICMFSLLFGCGATSAKPANTQLALPADTGKPISVYIASDLHYLSPSLHDEGNAFQIFAMPRDGKEIRYIPTVVDAFVSQVKKDKPDVLILSGDLTENGEKQSHLDLAEKLKTIPKTTKVLVVPGNHDIFDVNARGFKGDKQLFTEYVSDKDFRNIYADCGFKTAISKDKDSLSYLAAPTKKLWFLMLDTCKYKNNISQGEPEVGGAVKGSTFEWISQCGALAKSNGATLLVVQHHNLVPHNQMLNENFTVDNYEQVLDAYNKIGVPLVFSGHIHCQSIAAGKGIYDIASGALCVFPQHYGRLTFEGSTFSYMAKTLDVAAYAKSIGSSDKNLLNFASFEKDQFLNASKRIGTRLGENLSTEDQKTEVDALAELNLKYFSGDPRADFVKTKAYGLLMNEDGFTPGYVKSMLEDDGLSDQSLTFKLKKK